MIVEDPEHGRLLRLSHDLEGRELYPTPLERAEARIRELEAELRGR